MSLIISEVKYLFILLAILVSFYSKLVKFVLHLSIFFFKVYVFCVQINAFIPVSIPYSLLYFLLVLLYKFMLLTHLEFTSVCAHKILFYLFCHLDDQLSQYNFLNGSSFPILICKATLLYSKFSYMSKFPNRLYSVLLLSSKVYYHNNNPLHLNSTLEFTKHFQI